MMFLTIIVYPHGVCLRDRALDNIESLREFGEVKIVDENSSIDAILEEVKTAYFLLLSYEGRIEFSFNTISELIKNMQINEAGLVYSDYVSRGKVVRLNDYLPGSVRDDFDFGGLILFSTDKVKRVLARYGGLNYRKYGALYDLRLKLSIHYPIIHVKGAFYTMERQYEKSPYDMIFSYVDPKNRQYQEEMESIFTWYLKEIGAYIPADVLKNTDDVEEKRPFLASIVISVKNRQKTITDALKSAVSQKTDFPYNIIVVDNHSNDKTAELVDEFAKRYPFVKRIVPSQKGLEIGGCWNEAINHSLCGRYAVQLDSDDMFETPTAIQTIVDTFRELKCAMVVGTYKTVNENLEEIPPGIVDHKEWTVTNGHNNLLRVGGLGAPRAFDTCVIKRFGFRNISYGEDYAMGLRVSREYKVGRIFDCLYLARRWSDNTDSHLNPDKMRTLNEIKDRIRTEELRDRIAYVRSLKSDR